MPLRWNYHDARWLCEQNGTQKYKTAVKLFFFCRVWRLGVREQSGDGGPVIVSRSQLFSVQISRAPRGHSRGPNRGPHETQTDWTALLFFMGQSDTCVIFGCWPRGAARQVRAGAIVPHLTHNNPIHFSFISSLFTEKIKWRAETLYFLKSKSAQKNQGVGEIYPNSPPLLIKTASSYSFQSTNFRSVSSETLKISSSLILYYWNQNFHDGHIKTHFLQQQDHFSSTRPKKGEFWHLRRQLFWETNKSKRKCMRANKIVWQSPLACFFFVPSVCQCRLLPTAPASAKCDNWMRRHLCTLRASIDRFIGARGAKKSKWKSGAARAQKKVTNSCFSRARDSGSCWILRRLPRPPAAGFIIILFAPHKRVLLNSWSPSLVARSLAFSLLGATRHKKSAREQTQERWKLFYSKLVIFSAHKGAITRTRTRASLAFCPSRLIIPDGCAIATPDDVIKKPEFWARNSTLRVQIRLELAVCSTPIR